MVHNVLNFSHTTTWLLLFKIPWVRFRFFSASKVSFHFSLWNFTTVKQTDMYNRTFMMACASLDLFTVVVPDHLEWSKCLSFQNMTRRGDIFFLQINTVSGSIRSVHKLLLTAFAWRSGSLNGPQIYWYCWFLKKTKKICRKKSRIEEHTLLYKCSYCPQ